MKKIKYVILSIATIILFFGQNAAAAQDDSSLCGRPVQTAEGVVVGLTEKVETQFSNIYASVAGAGKLEACSWKGIPFATPPVGDLRLRAPQPPKPRAEIFKAYEYGCSCPQVEGMGGGGHSVCISEDCLTLNVWSPNKEGKFPVMFWMYGGGFVAGSGTYAVYDGTRLAAGADVVIVTMNYRLGALGYLALKELQAEDERGSVGNYGLLDQIRALEWVRDNIAGFGGDPDNVTIFGQSAGAMSVVALLASPSAKGLFHRAISISGPSQLMRTMHKAYSDGEKFVEDIGCGDKKKNRLECLRSLKTETFINQPTNDLAEMGVMYAPCIDGATLQGEPLTLIKNGVYNKVPTIIGNTRDELRSYTVMVAGLGLITRGAARAMLKYMTGANYKDIMPMYSFEDYRRPVDLLFTFGTELVFESTAYRIAEAMSGRNPVYVYRFDWDETRMPHKMGAFHALDVPFVFLSENIDDPIAKLVANKKTFEKGAPLALKVSKYYTNFAKTGDPNSPDSTDLPAWPMYDTSTRQRIVFDSEITTGPIPPAELKRLQYFAERPMSTVLEGAPRAQD